MCKTGIKCFLSAKFENHMLTIKKKDSLRFKAGKLRIFCYAIHLNLKTKIF